MNLIAWVRGKLRARRMEIQALPSNNSKRISGLEKLGGYGLVHGYTRIMTEAERLLLENARSDWISENWVALARLDRQDYEDHPERAKLALLHAAGHFQVGTVSEARECIDLAINWGVGRTQVTLVLTKGVTKSLNTASGALC